MKYTVSIALLAASIFLSGCDQPTSANNTPVPESPPVSTPTPAPDPVALLVKHLRRPNPNPDLVWSKPEFDVKKTDSLAKPIVGVIEVTCTKKDGELRPDGHPKWIAVYQTDLSFVDGAWDVDSVQVAYNGWGMYPVTQKIEDEFHWIQLFKDRYGF